eukprot:14920075-Heterocapsa_arctica.AAC.1
MGSKGGTPQQAMPPGQQEVAQLTVWNWEGPQGQEAEGGGGTWQQPRQEEEAHQPPGAEGSHEPAQANGQQYEQQNGEEDPRRSGGPMASQPKRGVICRQRASSDPWAHTGGR